MNPQRRGAVLLLGLAFCLSLPARAQQKPLTKEQVLNLVRNQLGDETGAKAIDQRGIDFEPGQDFLQSLKDAGANEAFLQALRTSRRVNSASEAAKKPLTQVQVMALLAGQVSNRRIATLVGERGIDFEPQDDYLEEVRLGGGEVELLDAIKKARVIKPVAVDTTAQARQEELRRHLAQGAKLVRDRQYPQGEQEYRAAARLDPQNAHLQVSLSFVLSKQQKWDEVITAARQALRLDPENDHAHNNLGVALKEKGDVEGAIAEYREALRLNPKNDKAHVNLGLALARKGDTDGALAEYREALRLNPRYDEAHREIGLTLYNRDDLEGAMAEFRATLRLNPNNDMAHDNLGVALRKKGDLEGAIAEYREALRLNPKNYIAHDNLGVALGRKSDPDGAITEFREALRLNPDYASAHYNLAVWLYKKGDRQGALGEFRAAYTLNPQSTQFKAAYEKLLREVK